jgi:prohibitin 2
MGKVIAIVGGVLGSIFGLILVLMSYFTIESGEVGIVKTWGEVTSIATEGLGFKTPFAQSVEKYDIRTKRGEAPCQASSKDLQQVDTKVSVNYRVDKSNLIKIYKTIGLDIENKIIDPRIQNIVKEVSAKYSATQLITDRELVRSEIEKLAKLEMAKYDIVIEGVQITNFNFSQQFADAVEAKIQAEQNSLKAKMELTTIQIEGEKTIVQAKAQAEAQRIQIESIKQNGGDQYIELKRIEKWTGLIPLNAKNVYVPASQLN